MTILALVPGTWPWRQYDVGYKVVLQACYKAIWDSLLFASHLKLLLCYFNVAKHHRCPFLYFYFLFSMLFLISYVIFLFSMFFLISFFS